MDDLTPEQLAEAKIQEMKKEAVALIEDSTKKEAIKRILIRGKATVSEIAEDFEVTEKYVRHIETEIKNI
jgi:hypothetical protein